MVTKTEDATTEAVDASEAAGTNESAATTEGSTGTTKTTKSPEITDESGLDPELSDDLSDDPNDDVDDALDDDTLPPAESATGAAQGAGAVVSAALGVVALSGSWVATVASARESLIGQLQTSQSASVSKQVSEVYGDSWHATALVGGIFALLALIVGAVVLARPAFGAPGRPQAVWIKSVAWAGVSLGVLGLLLAVAKYTDILMALPSASS